MSRLLRLVLMFAVSGAVVATAACVSLGTRDYYGADRAEGSMHKALKSGYDRSRQTDRVEMLPVADAFDSAV